MTSQQLEEARRSLWRQNANPLLTLEDATAWLDERGLCLFLPRGAQFPIPAPSFVEATVGHPEPTPSRPAIENANSLLDRLTREGHALPLNLFATFSEQPDFLATPETFRWIASLRADRDWKSAPAGRTAPLPLRVWELLDELGPLDAAAIRGSLGRELTEAAVLRALVELWSTLRVLPLYEANKPTRWALLKSTHPKQLAAATATSHATALSALVSLYLRSAVAATIEEVEVFLSPLTSRSRVREAVQGLTSTRQLESVALGPKQLLHIEGELPEFAESAPTELAASVEHREEAPGPISGQTPRQALDRPQRRTAARARPSEGGTRPPRRDSAAGPRKFAPRKPGTRPPARRAFGAAPGRTGSDRPRPYAAQGDRPAGRPRPERSGPERPRTDRPPSSRPQRFAASGEKPRSFRRDEERPRPFSGEDRPQRRSFPPKTGGPSRGGAGRPPRPYGERPQRSTSGAGDREGFRPPRRTAAPGEARPGQDRPQRRTFDGKSPGGAGRPERGGEKRGLEKRGFEKRAPRPGGERPRSTFRPSGDRPGRTGAPGQNRPQGSSFGPKTGGARPFRPQPFGKKTFGSKPAGKKPFGEKRFPPRTGGPNRGPSSGAANRPARSYSDRPQRPGAGTFRGKDASGGAPAKRPFFRDRSGPPREPGASPFKKPYSGAAGRPPRPAAREGQGERSRPSGPGRSGPPRSGSRPPFARKPGASRSFSGPRGGGANRGPSRGPSRGPGRGAPGKRGPSSGSGKPRGKRPENET